MKLSKAVFFSLVSGFLISVFTSSAFALSPHERARAYANFRSGWSVIHNGSADPFDNQYYHALHHNWSEIKSDGRGILNSIEEKINGRFRIRRFCNAFGYVRQAWLIVNHAPEENRDNMVAYCNGRYNRNEDDQIWNEFKGILDSVQSKWEAEH